MVCGSILFMNTLLTLVWQLLSPSTDGNLLICVTSTQSNFFPWFAWATTSQPVQNPLLSATGMVVSQYLIRGINVCYPGIWFFIWFFLCYGFFTHLIFLIWFKSYDFFLPDIFSSGLNHMIFLKKPYGFFI